MATRQAPRVPAGKGSLAVLAITYLQQRNLQDAFEESLRDAEDEATTAASRAAWNSLMHNGQLIMRQPPSQLSDLLITIGMASAYIDGVVGSLDGHGSDHVVVQGVQSALDNAFKFLIEQGATNGMPVALSPLIEEFCRNTGAPERGPAPRAEAA